MPEPPASERPSAERAPATAPRRRGALRARVAARIARLERWWDGRGHAAVDGAFRALDGALTSLPRWLARRSRWPGAAGRRWRSVHASVVESVSRLERWWDGHGHATVDGAFLLLDRRLRSLFAWLGGALRGPAAAVWWVISRIARRGSQRRLPAGTIVATRDDDLASIIGRIDTAEDVDLVLIVPRAARRLREAGVWARVSAHVRRRGITLGVVASRRDVRQHAAASGLRAAGTLRALRRSPVRRVRVGTREFELPRLRPLRLLRWLALPAVGAAVVGAACYVVPTAEIVIVPPSQPFTRAATVRVNPLAEEPAVGEGILPGVTERRTITTVLATETTGTTELGDERAAIVLLIANGGEAPVGVAEGTRVVSDSGIAFATVEAVAVPAGESLAVPATAERAGTIANVDADELWTLNGVPETLAVANPRAASGGTDMTVAAVAAEDIDRLVALAPEVLARVGGRELERTVESGTVFVESVTVAIVSQEPLGEVGEPAETLLMEFTAIVSGVVVRDEQRSAFGEALLLSELPEGMALLPATTEVELDAVRNFSGGELRLELRATGLTASLFDPSGLRDELTGARPAAAAALLRERLDLAFEPEVTVQPDWLPWRWLPRRGSRISITFAGPPPPDAGEPAAP